MAKRIYVFGTNTLGFHNRGISLIAYSKYGAQWGKCFGHYGDSFAIPVVDRDIQPLPLETIENFIKGFIAYAETHPKRNFLVTRIGCGIAGYTNKDIAPLFASSPLNCIFDEEWKSWLPYHRTYTGSTLNAKSTYQATTN